MLGKGLNDPEAGVSVVLGLHTDPERVPEYDQSC